ncbi:MAG: hypothetical protein U1F52_18495 [Burkholderiales bacterium]
MRAIGFHSLLVSLVIGLGGCAVWSPGEDPNGRRVIAKGDQVLEAMAAYSRARGQYPKSLMSLYPDYLQEERTLNFHLVADPGGDRLVVLYPPSWPVLGLVECSSDVRARKWKCQRSPLVP